MDGSSFNARVQIVLAEADSDALLLASIEDLSDLESEIDSTNKEFEALTSAAGHDLRGPLRILKGFTEALEDECGAIARSRKAGISSVRSCGRAIGSKGSSMACCLFARWSLGNDGENLDLSTLIELFFLRVRHAQLD